METEENTPDHPSPLPLPTCHADKQLYVALLQSGGQLLHPTGLQPALSGRADPLTEADAPSPMSCIPLISHQTPRSWLRGFRQDPDLAVDLVLLAQWSPLGGIWGLEN